MAEICCKSNYKYKVELCKNLAFILCKYTVVARKMCNTKFANSQQAQVVYTFQNTKEKLLKNKAAICSTRYAKTIN